jgi:hypothetical protein|tara:strand:- start:2095 stop:2514 length:420 start_codon:yes stop_codon:yes gene_type:complete
MAVLTHVNNDVVRIKNDVDSVSAAVTLTAADSGKWYELAASAGVVVTLPAVESGLNFRFVVANAFDTSNYVIDSAEGDNIDGILVVNGASVAASGEDQINFVASAESVGDFVDMWSDGNKWYVWGIGNSAGSITATDPS